MGPRSLINRSASATSAAVVIFTFRGSPSTSRTGNPARSTSVASSVASMPLDKAIRSKSVWNACGVCARYTWSRGTVSTTMPFAPARFTVSVARSAASAAPCSTAAASVRSMRSDDTSGRAASCTTTTSAPDDTRANASATESCRLAPPSTSDTGLLRDKRYGGGAARISGGRATMTSLTRPWSRNASTLRCRIGTPATASSCLGKPAPTRDPRPPAAMMADTCTKASRRCARSVPPQALPIVP